MANTALLNIPRARHQNEPLPLAFSFLSLPPEIRNMIYECAIFPDDNQEFFILNPKIQLSLLQVSRVVSREASVILYTRRIAVIAFLPHQFYLHGRAQPVNQLFRANNDDSTRILHPEKEPERHSTGHIYPRVLARFSRIRLCLFFPATFRTAYPLMFFDPIAELKSVLEVLRDHSPSLKQTSNRNSLEIIVAVYPRAEGEEVETSREARVREDFVKRGITEDLKQIRAERVLKVGGNFTKEGLVRFCKITCGV